MVLCFLMLSYVTTVHAQESGDDKHHMEKHRITVLEFKGVGVEEALLTSLADEARVALIDDLNLKDFIILTHENTLTILDDMGLTEAAFEGQDAVEIGRNIHVEFIITGTVAKVDKTYVVTLKMYDTNTAKLLYASHVESKKLSKLYKRVYKSTQQGIDEHLVLSE
jgi:TolB-like protein